VVTLRPATEDDAEFLLEMLLEAANWDPARAPVTKQQLRLTPELAHYVEGWPRTDDFGFVATTDGRRLGAAWCRQLTGTDPGYGYVADDVPEVSIAVVAPARGQGIGAQLLQAVADEARTRRTRALSLSVEKANPARRLYERAGFTVVNDQQTAVTMLLRLER
jgi:ribosomal protein S18 acetylase RimI-like enzyme